MRASLRILPFFFLALSGCGGGSSGTGAFSSGIDQRRPLSSLTAQERDQICARYESFARDQLTEDFSCTLVGIFDTLLEQSFTTVPVDPVAACEAVKAECLRNPDAFNEGGPHCDLASVDQLQDCGATVEELDRCLDESTDVLESNEGALSCNLITSPTAPTELETLLSDIGNTPACNSLKTKCPRIFDDE